MRGRGDRERPRFPPSCAAGSHLRLQQVGDGDDGDDDGDGDGIHPKYLRRFYL